MAETRTPRFQLPAWSDEVGDGPSMQDFNEAFQSLEVLAAKLTGLGRRNVVRNGDMSVGQRGNGAFTVNGVYTADGWLKENTGGTHSVTRSASGLGASSGINGAPFGLQSVVAAQSAVSDYAMFRSRIESVRTLAGKSVTLSFVAFATSGTPSISVEVEQSFGTGGSPSATVSSPVSAVVLSTTATRYAVSFTVPSITGKVLGTSGTDLLTMIFWLSAGSSFNARASSIGIQNTTIEISDVQLELGPDASPFERLPQQEQLAWCQRYFTRINPLGVQVALGTGMTISTTQARFTIALPVQMRATPVGSTTSNSFYIRNSSDNVFALSVVPGAYYAGLTSFGLIGTIATGSLVVGQAVMLESATGGGQLDVTAEL